MRQVRLALLEADVNFKVVKQFTAAVKERALGQDVLELAQPGPAGGEDRLRRADRADGRRRARPGVRQARADRDPDGRPAGLGQDHGLRQARPPPARGARHGRGRGRLRRLPARRRGPADQGRRPGRRARLRAGHRPRPGRHRRVGARPGQAGPARRADRRHQRPPARRRGAHGGARRDQEAHQAARRAARGRRDDRPGRGQRGRAVRRGRGLRRRGPDEARRRRPRRRGAVGQGGHRQADPVRVDRREARRLRALPPGPHGPAHPRHGRRDDAGREGRAPDRRGPGGRARAQDPQGAVHARRLPRADEAGAQDGPARRTC